MQKLDSSGDFPCLPPLLYKTLVTYYFLLSLSIDLNGLSNGVKTTTCPNEAAIYTAFVFSPSLKHHNHQGNSSQLLFLGRPGNPFSRLSPHVVITCSWDGCNMYALIHPIFFSYHIKMHNFISFSRIFSFSSVKKWVPPATLLPRISQNYLPFVSP
jgi:hypothetical protein